MPRVIAAAEWAELERGIKQRVTTPELLLADRYGEQNTVRDEVIPKRLVSSAQHARPPERVRRTECASM